MEWHAHPHPPVRAEQEEKINKNKKIHHLFPHSFSFLFSFFSFFLFFPLMLVADQSDDVARGIVKALGRPDHEHALAVKHQVIVGTVVQLHPVRNERPRVCRRRGEKPSRKYK